MPKTEIRYGDNSFRCSPANRTAPMTLRKLVAKWVSRVNILVGEYEQDNGPHRG